MQDTTSEINRCISYLKKAALYGPLTQIDHDVVWDVVVVIPAYMEDDLLTPINSLLDCILDDLKLLVIVVINYRSDDGMMISHNQDQLNMLTALNMTLTGQHIAIAPLIIELQGKHAGVGLARKIGMDEAVRCLVHSGNPIGVIAQFDADCRCDPDYIQELYKAFRQDDKLDAVSIYFEHDLNAAGPDLEAIKAYELHLRYFIQAQRYTGHPHIHHTVGSSMAVRCSSYCSYGGMNKRKAGEDFYFLNKIARYGVVRDLVTTRVIASPRRSDRVPFGTGRAMLNSAAHGEVPKTYHFKSFRELKEFISAVMAWDIHEKKKILPYHRLTSTMSAFISERAWTNKWGEILEHTSSTYQAQRRFFQWFDAFKMLQFCHYYRDHERGLIDTRMACEALWNANGCSYHISGTYLDRMRRLDRRKSQITA